VGRRILSSAGGVNPACRLDHLDTGVVVLEDENGSSFVRTPARLRGATFADVSAGVRKPLGFLRGLDPLRVDALVAFALLITIELEAWLGPQVGQRPAASAAGAVLCGAVAVRRRWPLGVVVGGVTAVLVQEAAGGRLTQQTAGSLAATVLVFYGAGAFLDGRRAWVGLAVGLVGIGGDDRITGAGLSAVFFGAAFLIALPWLIGRMLREQAARERADRERAEQLDAEREQRATMAAYGERIRIARELHDVIAHSISVMVIQAGGARTVMESAPQRAAASLDFVQRAGREALAEMRRLLGVLDAGADPRALAPQPGLADLKELIARTCRAGLATDLVVEGVEAPISPALHLCAYRIVQEALTNAIKHAGPAHAGVHLRWAPDSLELEVVDDGRGPAGAHSSGGGHGIAGMRERAGLHGGTIQAGAGGGGGFTVRARLPLDATGAR
jgi:signal transduction histidine kinase